MTRLNSTKVITKREEKVQDSKKYLWYKKKKCSKIKFYFVFLQFIKLHTWNLVCCDSLPWNRLSIMHTSLIMTPNVLIANQWSPPVCQTCTEGDSLISFNCSACLKAGSCRLFTSVYSGFSIFYKMLITSSLSTTFPVSGVSSIVTFLMLLV